MRQVTPPLSANGSPRGRAGGTPPPVASRAPRHDPAPSRWSYRMHRMWLRPSIRRLIRIGVPLLVVGASVAWYFGDDTRRQNVVDFVADTRRTIEERPEFMVKLMAVDGASPELSDVVRSAVTADFPVSSFDLDLDQLREGIVALDAVADARVRIRPGGILQIDIDERKPALVWRTEAGLMLLDAKGHRVAQTPSRADWPELPLIAGRGARDHVVEALELIDAADPLKDRIRGLVRVGERRWNLELDRDQRILLPELRPVQALEGIIALDQARKILDRDVVQVDLRNPSRPTLRLAENAVTELRRIKGITQ